MGLDDASASTSTGSTARSRPNAGFLVGHSTIRRVVMGERATQGRGDRRRARGDGAAARREPRRGRPGLLVVVGAHAQRRRRRHGAVAVRDRRRAHRAVPRSCRDHPGTTLEFIPCVGQFEDYAPDLMTRMSLAANRPLNWNVLFVSAGQRSDGRAQPRGVRLRGRARRPGARADDARRAVAAHLLRQRLPARHDPRLAEADGAAARREEGDARERRRAARRCVEAAGGGNRARRHRELADLRDQRDVRAREQAVRGPHRRRHRARSRTRTRSTRCSTSSSPTT